MSQQERPLGRLEPTDDRHLQRWSLTADTLPRTPTPVCLGISWYSGFDRPTQAHTGAAYWIGRGDFGRVRGGHAICVKPPELDDVGGWWTFYDQGNEGACVGFALSRVMSLLNRTRFDAPWLYHAAQRIDDWAGEDYDGTSVRAGCDVLRGDGHIRVFGGRGFSPELRHGISANRWADSVEEVAACLQPRDNGLAILNAGYVTLCNSWGRSYPHFVRLPHEALRRLLDEDGEGTIATDR